MGQRSATAPKVGKYRVIAELGSGGMADVYLGVAEGLGGFAKLQVIKRLKAEMQGDPEMLAMFLDEARLAARLNHANVVQTNEVGEADGRYFIAMEYIEGQSLARIAYEHQKRRKEPFPLRLYLRLIADFLPGLRYAHALSDFDGTLLNLVHRDISPHNVMVTYDGVPKVVDFGIAKATTNSNETRKGVFKGKINYSAPEQMRGSGIDGRADIYSVGVMIWEAVAGRRMWKGVQDLVVIHHVLAGELPSLREAKPDAPDEIVRICERATARDPEDRYPGAAELQADLEAFIGATWGHVTAQEAGALVSEIFHDERGRVRSTVDSKLALFRANPDTHITIVNMSEVAPNSMQSPSSPSVTLPTGGSSSVVEVLAPSESKPDKKRQLVIVGLATALLGGGVAWLAARPAVPPASANVPIMTAAPTAPAPSATAAASASAPAAAPSTVAVVIKATPSQARLFLDDQRLPSNPYEAKLPADLKTHQIRAEADGFVSSTETITLDRDAKVQLALRPRTGGGAAPRGKDEVPSLSPKAADKPKPALDTIQ